jgi:hypothetical protein
LGVWSDATDGYDESWDFLIDPGYVGYAAVFHEYAPPDWDGPTGYYSTDNRKLLLPEESKTFAPITLWATSAYEPETMAMAIEADVYFTPPADRSYVLELLYVPEGINGAPEVGTTWDVPLDKTFVVTVPTYRWSPDGPDDPHGYLFAFTITAVPEPASLLGLMMGGLLVRAHRRGRHA